MTENRAIRQLADTLLAFDNRLDRAILEGMENVLNFAAKLSITEYMVPGARDPIGDRANPPPGPLKIRSGQLKQGTTVISPKKVGTEFVGALANDTPYAAIHEFGGTTSPHFIEARNADTLAFVGRDGGLVFRDAVFHPGSKIPARPFLEPAVDQAQEEKADDEIGEAMLRAMEEAIDQAVF